ncbi:MAG: hypothetical protein V4609_02675 [Pseudomonadota bacterium]
MRFLRLPDIEGPGGRRLVAVLAAALAVFQAGCASMLGGPSGTLGPPVEVSRVALRVEPLPVAVEFIGVPGGKGQAATEGAGRFFAQCAVAPGGGGGGSFLAAAYMLWLAGCAVAAPIAAGVAGHKAMSADDVTRSTALISDAMAVRRMAEDLRRALLAAGDRIAPGQIEPDGAAAPLVLVVPKIAFIGRGDSDGLLAFQLRVQASVERAPGEAPVKTCSFSYPSERRSLAEWSADGGQGVNAVLERAMPALAEAITECVFLLYPFPYQGLPSGWTWFSGLQAEYPKRSGSFKDPYWATVDDLKPTFRWQAFPRDVDLAADRATMQRVRDVEYDLVIAQWEDGGVNRVVYRRSALAANAHQIETALDPATRYLWTVRARFRLDGRAYVTAWAERGGLATGSDPPARQSFTAPSEMSYPFKTP